MLVEQLLYVEKYTIEGARSRVDEFRKTGKLKPPAQVQHSTREHRRRPSRTNRAELERILDGERERGLDEGDAEKEA